MLLTVVVRLQTKIAYSFLGFFYYWGISLQIDRFWYRQCPIMLRGGENVRLGELIKARFLKCAVICEVCAVTWTVFAFMCAICAVMCAVMRTSRL